MTLLGPWTFGLGIFYPPYLTFMRNMEFFNFSYSFFLTLIIWITNLVVFMGYWYYEWDSFNVGFLFLAGIATITRAANIASKYATFSPLYRRRLMNYDLSREEREKYFLLGGWSNQDLTFAEDEILHCMKRRNIDESTFKLSFIVKPSEDVDELLNDIRCQNQQSGEIDAQTSFGSSVYFDCKSLFYGLVKIHMQRERGDWVFMLAIIAGFVWGLGPGIGRSLRNQMFYGNDEIEILVWFAGMLVYSMLMILASVFFLTAWNDLDRVNYIMGQLSQMYSPDKIMTITEGKVYPTINLADAVSLRGWMDLRKVLVGYGARYFNRHELFTNILLAFIAICGFGIFTFDTFGINISEREQTVCQVVLYFTVVIYGAMFIVLTRNE